MTSKEIREKLTKLGYVLIAPSLFYNEDKTFIIFNAYDKLTGSCTKFYISIADEFAEYQNLSAVLINETHKCSHWFF